MSARLVTTTYRQIIDTVIDNVKPDFEEAGIEDGVIEELKRIWETKLAASRVADFSSDERLANLMRQAGSSARAEPTTPSANNNKTAKKGKGANSVKKESKGEEEDDGDEIGSELDSSDDDLAAINGPDDGVDGGDFVIALYEKVSRVKTKWKVQLKDGIISVNGKDYLFSKCSGQVSQIRNVENLLSKRI